MRSPTLAHVHEPTTPTQRQHGFLTHTSRAVYGTIVATAVIAAEASALTGWRSEHFLVVLIATVLILWFAEIYANVLTDHSGDGLRVRIRTASGSEWAVVQCAVPLGIPFLLGMLGIINDETAVWASLIVAVVALGTWGGIASYQRGRPARRVVLAVLLSAAIGVLIIILKAIAW